MTDEQRTAEGTVERLEKSYDRLGDQLANADAAYQRRAMENAAEGMPMSVPFSTVPQVAAADRQAWDATLQRELAKLTSPEAKLTTMAGKVVAVLLNDGTGDNARDDAVDLAERLAGEDPETMRGLAGKIEAVAEALERVGSRLDDRAEKRRTDSV